MAGAPTNTNAAGSTLEIIRACLVTGFNLKSVVSATVASGVMTINYAAAHGYEDKVLIRLDGAAGGSIVRRATAVAGSSSLTIPAAEFIDGAVSGTLSTRVAPADWDEAFTDTNVGVFRSKVVGPGSTRFFYRVADTASGGQPRILRGYESMSDASTGDGPFPTSAQETGEGVPVTRSVSGTARPWVVISDQRTCYLFFCYATDSDAQSTWFGDMDALQSADDFCGAVSYYSVSLGGDLAGRLSEHYTARARSGVPGAARDGRFTCFGARLSGVAPANSDGFLTFARPIVCTNGLQNGTNPARAHLRGVMHVYESMGAGMWSVFESVSGISGRVLVVKDFGGTYSVALPVDEDWM